MKNTLKPITPLLLLLGYSIIAGGSLEDIGTIAGALVAIVAVLSIIAAISVSSRNDKKRKEGLAKAEDQFGSHTSEVEYQIGKYILFDKPNHRILLKDCIMDSQKIKELKITRREPKTKVTYKEETETKTSTGSVIGRGVVGALVAGPVGAVVGGVTAKQKTEIKKTPEYQRIPGRYIIEVIDTEGKSRVSFATSDESEHDKVRQFLQEIIDSNTMDERMQLEQAKEDEYTRLLLSDTEAVRIGSTSEVLKDILINSKAVKDEGNDVFQLCPEAVTLINNSWNSNFENVIMGIKDGAMNCLKGISSPYTVGTFKNMQLDMRVLADRLASQYGTPKANGNDVQYTSLTDDNNRINAYSWEDISNQELKIDYICDKGKYKYELNGKSID